MPRTYKPKPVVEPFNTGRATQAPAAPTGGPYGEHQKLINDQKAIALPGSALNPGRPAGVPAAATAQPAAPTAAGAPAAAPPQLGPLAAMQQMTPPTPLTAPTERPGEPVTAGLGNLPLGAPAPAPNATVDPLLFHQALYQVASDHGFANADLADLVQHLDG